MTLKHQKASIGDILMHHNVTPLAELVDDLEDWFNEQPAPDKLVHEYLKGIIMSLDKGGRPTEGLIEGARAALQSKPSPVPESAVTEGEFKIWARDKFKFSSMSVQTIQYWAAKSCFEWINRREEKQDTEEENDTAVINEQAKMWAASYEDPENDEMNVEETIRLALFDYRKWYQSHLPKVEPISAGEIEEAADHHKVKFSGNTADQLAYKVGFVTATKWYQSRQPKQVEPVGEEYTSYPRRDFESPHITTDEKYHSFFVELTALINRHSKDAEAGTPDYVLAEYMISSLKTFCSTLENRMAHIYGRSQSPANQTHDPEH